MTEVQRLAKIMVLKDLLKEYELLAKYNGGTDYDRYCALDMAIKALEQEPCEDAISRQAALDAFGLSEKTRKYGGDHSGYDTLMKYEIQDVLEDLPPVNPQEPKIGHWIKHDGYWECSECHAERAYGNEYCPDCGSHNGDIAKPYKESEVEE